MALRTQSVIAVALLRSQQFVRGLATHDQNGEQQQQQKQQQTRSIKAEANAYEVLGLPESCNEVSIRATFRKLAKATHPDLQTDTSTAHFIRILAAYEILSDPPKPFEIDWPFGIVLFILLQIMLTLTVRRNVAVSIFEQILSDPAKRTEYDKHLRSKRAFGNPQPDSSQAGDTSSSGYNHESASGFDRSSGFYEQQDSASSSNTEVVSWLKGYRAMVKDVVNRQEIGRGDGGWEEELRWEMQSALKRAYFGPQVSEQQGLPECFEAEERAQKTVEDVLHLVSGRQLFGFVRQVQNPALEGQNDGPFLLEEDALETRANTNATELSSLDEASDLTRGYHSFRGDSEAEVHVQKRGEGTPFVDLELQLFGNVVARSIRVPYKDESPSKTSSGEEDDCIYIYLSSEQVEDATEFVDGTVADDSKFSRTLLGTIRGLRSVSDQNVCFAHAPDGKRTHLILQHTTPLVKHMQWFRIGEESAACECRCRRASTLPSRCVCSAVATQSTVAQLYQSESWMASQFFEKYWIFEPRTDTHNVGGWYIETFEQTRRSSRRSRRSHFNKYGSRKRESVGMDDERRDKLSDLLHPAMYIMAAAYKTLDEEDKASQKREGSLQNQIKKKLRDLPHISSRIALWWKQKWNS